MLLAACGPSVGVPEDESSSGASEGSATTASTNATTSTPGTSATTGPGTSGTTITAGGTADETTSTTDPDTTLSFVDSGPDDGGEVIECDQWIEDCPRGEKCMPWANDGGSAWNATRCSPLDPDPRQPGESCSVEGSAVSGIDNCELHSMCWDVDPETNMGTCVAMCVGSELEPACVDDCSRCALSGAGVLILCLPICDPLAADACDDGDACVPVDGSSFACIPDASGDIGAAGDPCEFPNACDPGLACLNGESVPGCESNGCCSPFCSTGDADPCEAQVPGSVCTPWFAGGEDPNEGCTTGAIGVCAAP